MADLPEPEVKATGEKTRKNTGRENAGIAPRLEGGTELGKINFIKLERQIEGNLSRHQKRKSGCKNI